MNGGIWLDDRSFLKKLLKVTSIETKKYIVNQIWCFTCLLVYTISSVFFPSFLSKVIDIGVLKNDNIAIFRYSTEMLICGIFMIIFFYVQKVSFFKFGNDIVMNTKKSLYNKLNNVNIIFWNKHKVGNILTILDNDIGKMQELLTSNISELVVNIFLCVGISLYIIGLNYKIGFSVVGLSFCFAFIQKHISNKSKEKMKKLRELMGDFNSYTTETVNNIPALQMTGKNKYIKKIYEDKCNQIVDQGLDFTKTMSYVSVVGMAFNIIAIILVLLIGSLDVSKGNISVGLLFSLTIYVQRLYSPIVAIGNVFVKIKNFIPLFDNIYEVMFSEDIIINGTYRIDDNLKGKIEFENVWFKYNENKYVLKGFSETFETGEIVGIIGENGSGKTTIGKLLTKLCTVNNGKIKIDGVNIKDYNLDYLQEQIGVMTQDSFMLTNEINEILDNKLYMEQIQEFLEKMNFSDTGNSILNDGFRVKENGLNISGGEAQKLALYKLYLDNKPICILDEPTASLDSISEERIIDFIKNSFKDKTVIIITHKPEILNICTKIIDLNIIVNSY